MTKVKIGGVYKTGSGNLLRLVSVSGFLYNFILVDEQNQVIKEVKNKFGVVIIRSSRQYTEVMFNNFKLVN